MSDRRGLSRRKPELGQRLLTLHATRGHVCGRAEDESDGGLGIRVRDVDGLTVGQVVLVHRMHEDQLRVGTIRYLEATADCGARVGIELHPECA